MSRSPAELGVPEGWFAVAFSHELKPGRVTSGVLAGQPIVVWRTASGQIGASGAHCPHLGAHLGRGGTVEGETLRCPFHGFRFGLDGGCVATGYDTRPPRAATLATIPVVERHGAVLAWHHPAGDRPGWTVPAADPTAGPVDTVDGDHGLGGSGSAAAEPRWGRLRTHSYELPGHPQETSENSVDLGHLAIVHGYRRVEPQGEPEADGPVLRVAYAMHRPLGLPGTDRAPGLRRLATRVSFRATLHGLGVSVVEASIPRLGVRTHQLVLATPTESGRITLRIGMRVALPFTGTGNTAGRRAVRTAAAAAGAATRLATEAALLGFRHDVARDVPIWAAKAYLPTPAVAAGDGPILAYRRWAAQFYPAAETESLNLDQRG